MKSQHSFKAIRARMALVGLFGCLLCVLPCEHALAQAVSGREGKARERLKLARCTVEDLKLPSAKALADSRSARQSIRIPVTLKGLPATLSLQPSSLRSPGFRLLVQRAAGKLEEEPPPPPSTWRGQVEGQPGSMVAASLVEGSLRATIHGVNGARWTIQPLKDADRLEPAEAHVVFEAQDALPVALTCAAVNRPADQAAPAAGGGMPPPPPPPAAEASVFEPLFFAQIAFDSDVEFYQANGSSFSATMADIEGILNAVDAIFMRDVAIGYDLTRIIIRTAEPDPYTATEVNALITQFQSHWLNNQGDIPRDLAHLMTGKDLEGDVGGAAWPGVTCINPGQSFGLSQSRWSGNYQLRVLVTAHELGHNWGACHCDEAGCGPAGQTDCDIMNSGVSANPANVFGQFSRTTITAHKRNNSGCLTYGDAWVDEDRAAPPLLGTPSNPYGRVVDGTTLVHPRGRVIIHGPHHYRENLTINRPLTLHTDGGPVTIGN